MLQMLDPLFGAVLKAALLDADFRRWVEAEFSDEHVELLERQRLRLEVMGAVLKAALLDADFRRWVEAEFSDEHVELLERLRLRLEAMCKARGW